MTEDDPRIPLYKEMSEMTAPICGKECGTEPKNRCCSLMYCQAAQEYAKDTWGIDLKETEHDDLLYMGPEGCTVLPHLRPICTIHICDINSLGYRPGHEEWTAAYYDLRNRIDELEWEAKEEKE